MDPTAVTLVADRVWSLATDSGSNRVHHTQCYLLLDDEGGVHVIDPGEDTKSNELHLAAALSRIGRHLGDIATIVVTHYHHDHLGGADRLRGTSGAPLVIHEVEQAGIRYSAHRPTDTSQLERWGVPNRWWERLTSAWHWIPEIEANVLLAEGALLDAPGRRLRVEWTPGHTEGHLCVVDEDQGLLFSGDHVLPDLTPGVGERITLPANPITTYLDALERTARLDGSLVLPGHGAPFAHLAERCDQIATRHRTRTLDVARIMHNGAQTAWSIASLLPWSGGWEPMPDSVRRSALHQVELHMELVLEAGAR